MKKVKILIKCKLKDLTQKIKELTHLFGDKGKLLN